MAIFLLQVDHWWQCGPHRGRGSWKEGDELRSQGQQWSGEKRPLIGFPATEQNTFVTGWVLRVLLRCMMWNTDYTLHIHTHSQKHTGWTPPSWGGKEKKNWWWTIWMSSFQLWHSLWFCGVEMTLREFFFSFLIIAWSTSYIFSKVFSQISTFKTFSPKLAIGQFWFQVRRRKYTLFLLSHWMKLECEQCAQSSYLKSPKSKW